MARKDWVWMGRPAHFIAAQSCHFRLATYIPASKVIVSTVGDYDPAHGNKELQEKIGKRPVEIGYGRTYETFVFNAVKAEDCDGCQWHILPSEIDTEPANTANDAAKNHYALCEKWDRTANPGREGGR